MAAALEKEFGIEAELIRGGRGAFEVLADGQLIYSKYKTGRHATHDEILAAVREIGAPARV